MTVVLRPGQRIVNIPGIGITTHSGRKTLHAAAPANWWEVVGKTCAAAHQAKGAASYAASKINLANSGTYDLSNGTAYPTWDTAIGWTLDGSTQWLASACPANMKPVTYLARMTAAGVGVYQTVLGSQDGTGGIDYQVTTSNKMSMVKQYVVAIGNSTATISASTNYVVGVTYSGAGAWAHYRDGSPDGSGTNDQTFTASRTLVVGGIYQSGFAQPFGGIIQAVAIYSDVLTAGEVATVSAAMAAL